MKPRFLVFLGLIINIVLITNNQAAYATTLKLDPCQRPNPPSYCVGSNNKFGPANDYHRGCSKSMKCHKTQATSHL